MGDGRGVSAKLTAESATAALRDCLDHVVDSLHDEVSSYIGRLHQASIARPQSS